MWCEGLWVKTRLVVMSFAFSTGGGITSRCSTGTATGTAARAEEERLKLIIRKLQHRQFGHSSERRVEDDRQGQLFALGAVEPGEERAISIKQHTRQVRRDFGDDEEEAPEGTFPQHLPREDQVVDEKPQGVAEEDLEQVSEKVTERLASTPEQHRVIRIVRRVYKQKSTGKMLPAPAAPKHVLDQRCKVDETFLVLMVIKKCLWHMPLYRQHQELALQGIRISRDRLVYWTIKFAAVLEAVPRALANLIRAAPVVHCDETPGVVGKKSGHGKKKYQTGYFWPILAEGIGVVFFYRSTRNKEELGGILEGFTGTLVSDALDVYEGYVEEQMMRWQICWMHIRRNFIEAEASNPDLARIARRYIRELYRIEDELADETPERRTQLRLKHSKPVLDEFHRWLVEQSASPAVITDEAMSTAVWYVLKRWDAASLFVYDGAIPIDNGAAERAIRPGKLGMKNWLHCASEAGAETMAVFYSLIGSALMHSIHPYYYLLDLCRRIDDPALSAEDLVPGRWKERFFEEAVPEHLRQLNPRGSPFVGDPARWHRST